MKLFGVGALCLAGIVGMSVGQVRANLIYNFDTAGSEASNGGHGDGANIDGWTDTLGASEPTFINTAFNVLGGRTAVVPGQNQDAQNANLVFTSPAFYLTGNSVNFDMSGGMLYGSSSDPTGQDSLPVNISNIAAGNSSGTGILVLGLRDVATGNYVSFYSDPSTHDQWQSQSWDVSAFVNNGKQYVIDMIDTRTSGWGHIEIDNVNIPGVLPEPASLGMLAIAAGSLVLRRRRCA